MSRVCELTGTRPNYGNKVSHSNIKTRTRWMPNLREKKYLIPELGMSMSIMLCTRAIRTIDKVGSITTAIMRAKEDDLSERMQKIRRTIYKARVKATAAGKVNPVKKPTFKPGVEKVAAAKVVAPKAAAKAKKVPAKKAAKKDK